MLVHGLIPCHNNNTQPGSDGIRLPAVKFVEVVILLYTPDPGGSSEPPLHPASEGNNMKA